MGEFVFLLYINLDEIQSLFLFSINVGEVHDVGSIIERRN